MIALTSLITLLLPLSLVSASHLPPPHKRNSGHERAKKNFQHIHASENETTHQNSTLVPRGPSFSGTGTFYYTGLGACGQYSKDSDFMVALNSAQYGGGYPGPQCFKSISIQANGKTVGGVTIMDECPTCGYGSLDLSPGLFTQFAGEDAGVISITWWFNDDAPAAPTSEKPTSTWVEPTSTYTPPTSTWVAPTSTYTPPTSTWTPEPSPTPSSTTTQIEQSSVTSTSAAASSSSTITSSATGSSISASASITGSIISHNATNPYVVVSTNGTAAATAGLNSNDSNEDGSDSTSSSGSGSGQGSGNGVLVNGNIQGLNGLVAQYGQLVVVAAEAA